MAEPVQLPPVVEEDEEEEEHSSIIPRFFCGNLCFSNDETVVDDEPGEPGDTLVEGRKDDVPAEQSMFDSIMSQLAGFFYVEEGDGVDENPRTVMDLSYKPTPKLPAITGERARIIVRIDLTQSNIESLRGLNVYSRLRTLVLDHNQLAALPDDCPPVPSLHTLWVNNNNVSDLDRFIDQVAAKFPNVSFLALMANPAWPYTEFAENPEVEKWYRLTVIHKLPELQVLDSRVVSEAEREEARNEPPPRPASLLFAESESGDEELDEVAEDTGPRQHEGSEANDEYSTGAPCTWEREAIVMDVGSGWTKVGLAGAENPAEIFPSLVGRVDLGAYDVIGGQEERIYVGNEAFEEATKRITQQQLPDPRTRPSPLELTEPVQRGIVTDWDDMELVWRYGIEHVLRADAAEHPVLFSDSSASDNSQRERATEVLFETFDSPALYMALQPVLSLYACGLTTGLVLDIGESGTQVAPIHDGLILEQGVLQLGLSGQDLTRRVGKLANARVGGNAGGGRTFDLEALRDAHDLRGLKEACCFVSENIEKDDARMEISMIKTHHLPDGTKVTLGRERYQSTEMLFDPSLIGRPDDPSLQQGILQSMLQCAPDTRTDLARTVLMTGGTSELEGLSRRLQRELTKMSKSRDMNLRYTVAIPEASRNAVWLGGSILASLGASADGIWFTRRDYEEYGVGHVHQKFGA